MCQEDHGAIIGDKALGNTHGIYFVDAGYVPVCHCRSPSPRLQSAPYQESWEFLEILRAEEEFQVLAIILPPAAALEGVSLSSLRSLISLPNAEYLTLHIYIPAVPFQ